MKVLFALGALLVFVAAVKAECEDKRKDCFNFDLYCNLKPYENYVKEWCPKYCGFCGTTKPDTTVAPSRPTLPRTMGPSMTHPPIGACGQQVIPNSRIISGETAKRGSWPWQILMLHNNRASCGGTIVSPTWIITAAHCVSGKESSPNSFSIRVGEHNRNSREGSEVDMPVQRVISHPSWSRNNMNNDIAMIQLARPIQFNDYVQPACLPTQDVQPSSPCYITGWGKTSHPGSMTSILQQTILPVVDNQQCENKNKNVIPVKITSAMICGGHGGATRQSGCHGDSGGPYVCKVGGRWEIHGAVSHGSPTCSASETYTVFARVNFFRGWISQNMAMYGI